MRLLPKAPARTTDKRQGHRRAARHTVKLSSCEAASPLVQCERLQMSSDRPLLHQPGPL